MRTTSVRIREETKSESTRAVGEPTLAISERMKREEDRVGDRTIVHERSARRVTGYFDEGRPADFSGQSEERASYEVSIAGKVGEWFTAPVRFADLAAHAKSNQSLEPTTLLGTSAAEQPLVPSRVVAHL